MSFRISKHTVNGISLVHLFDDSQSVKISIVPEHGAMLHEFELALGNGRYNIIDNYASEDDIQENLKASHKSSKLSPFPCRIKNAKYTYEGKSYEFQNKFKDGSAIHGLLANKKFRLSDDKLTATQASVEFTYAYSGDDPGYPFKYTCSIRYTLLPDKILQIQTILKNDDRVTIPLGDGWHPYFKLGAPVDACSLWFPSSGMLEFDEHLIPTGNVLPFSGYNEPTIIGAAQLDNCFLLNDAAGKTSCIFSNPANGLSIQFTADENYPYLQIYTPPDRNSIAIENLSAAPDCFNNKMGLLLLQPGKQSTLTLQYRVKTS